MILTDKFINSYIHELTSEFPDINKLPEVHYSQLDSGGIYKNKLANRYAQKIIDSDFPNVFFTFTIIDVKSLKKEFGHGSKRDKNIQKKFMKICILSVINKYVRRFKDIYVKDIFLDSGGKADDTFFKKYALFKIKSRTKAKLPKEVTFIDSDHHKESEKNVFNSIFIQICDLFLGIFKECISEKKGRNKYKQQIANRYFEFIHTCWICKSKIGICKTYPKNREIIKHILKKLNTNGEKIELVKYKYTENLELRKKYYPRNNKCINFWR